MSRDKIRVLFTDWVDAHNFNAQSLNAREIALRLNPQLFHSTLFYEKSPDPRLVGKPSIRLIRITPRFGTLQMLVETFQGFDIIFRAPLTRFMYFYFHIPSSFRGQTAIIDWLEGYEPERNYPLSPQYLKYSKFIQPHVKHHIGITEYVACRCLEAYNLQSQGIIPVGVDTRLFNPPPRRSNEVPVVLFVGTLIARKVPHGVLIAARHFPNTKFVIVGAKRDSFYLNLQSLMNKWKLTNLTLLDPMPQSELVKLMQQSDIFLHPSRCEGLPKVVLESAATGLPAIIFNNYQAPAVIDGVTGFQVKTSKEMLTCLTQLVEDPQLRRRMGEAAASHAKQFDWNLIVQQWEQVFLDVVRGRRGSEFHVNGLLDG